MAEVCPETPLAVMQIWKAATKRALDPVQEERFLSRPEAAELAKIPTKYVRAAFDEQPKLDVALSRATQLWKAKQPKTTTKKNRGPQRVGRRDLSRSLHSSIESSEPITGSFGQSVFVSGHCSRCLRAESECFCG